MLKKIPVGWHKFILKDLFDVREERHPNNGKFPLCSLTIEEGVVYKPERYIREFLVKSKDKAYKKIYKGDLVFNPMNLRWGAIAFSKINETVIASPVYEVLYLKDSKIADPYFLECMFETPSFMNLVKTFAEGTLIERMGVNIKNFLQFSMVLPSINEQHKISGILSTIDSVISQTQAVIDQTQTLKKGLMQELFTHGIPGRHKKFKKTEIGEIPAEWEVKKLEELATLITKGESPHWQGFKYTESGCLFVTSENVRDGFIDLNNPKFVPIEFHEGKLERSKLKERDVLVNLVGASIGRCCLFIGWKGPANINQAVALIRCNHSLIPEYLMNLVNGDYVQDSFTHSKVATARPNISLSDLRNLKIPLPDLKEQQRELAIFNKIDDSVTQEKKLLLSLYNLKSALMQVLLSGEVRVKV